MKKVLYILSALFLFTSCEDVIKVNVDQKQVKMVVDAFVNNLPDTQSIYIKKTAAYFAPIGQQESIDDASVYILDTTNLRIFQFTSAGKGRYIFVPNAITGDTFTVGTQYILGVIKGTDTFVSVSTMNATAPILDIKKIYQSFGGNVDGPGPKQGDYAELFAQDRAELGNTYWIKSFRNDTFLSSLSQLNIAWDESFSPNDATNGGNFIFPIRFQGINDFNRPLLAGDKVRVEIHSITNETFAYFQILQIENQNGGLFATPPSSIPTNIIPLNAGNKTPTTGWFNMAAASRLEKQF
jgi:hypothetical protein